MSSCLRTILLAAGADPCPQDPFASARGQSLKGRFPGQSFAAYAYDTRTGCAYWMHPDERLRTASVFTVMVMAGTLYEDQWLVQLEPWGAGRGRDRGEGVGVAGEMSRR